MNDQFFMQLAVDEAWKYQGLTYPNPAVGAVVLGEKGQILAIDAHKKAGEPHAEVLALQKAYIALSGDKEILTCKSSKAIHDYLIKNHNHLFTNCTLYSTLEPCSHIGKTPSCANLISKLQLKRVVIGVNDSNTLAAQGSKILQKAGIEVVEHINHKACSDLIEPFTIWQKEPFITYKWAQRLDGTIDGGTISSKSSREFVHAMRNISDLLIIGGNTVRVDRPTLDARLVNGKAPDILIYSRQKDFDKTIPLFLIPDREVYISDSLDMIKRYKNIVVEGGAKLFASLHTLVHRHLLFISTSSGGELGAIDGRFDFELLHVSGGEDIQLWMKEK